MTPEAIDYPVPWWLWVIIGVIGLVTLVVFSLLAFVGKSA